MADIPISDRCLNHSPTLDDGKNILRGGCRQLSVIFKTEQDVAQ
jgi:hypothetical protein